MSKARYTKIRFVDKAHRTILALSDRELEVPCKDLEAELVQTLGEDEIPAAGELTLRFVVEYGERIDYTWN